MGMMLLSTAAAVSGTMAWFSASRSIQVSANDFAVEAIDGALDVAASEWIGPATVSADSKTISLTANHTLADASFDYRANQEKLYTDTVDANDSINGYQDLGNVSTVHTAWLDTDTANAADDTWNVPGSESAHYGFAFKLTFSYDFKTDHRTLGLFFNALADQNDTHLGSYVTNQTLTAGSNGENTYKGFRMAFIGNADRFVWAPNRTSAEVTANSDLIKTVTGTTNASSVTTVASADLILKDSNVAQAANGNETTNKGYLGTLAYPQSGTRGTSEVICVVWYEGTDPAVVNASSMDKVSSVLKFYVRATA